MNKGLAAIAILTVLIATNASAQVQGVDLNGRYQCVLQCSGAPGSPAFITQSRREPGSTIPEASGSTAQTREPSILQTGSGSSSTVERSGSGILNCRHLRLRYVADKADHPLR